MKKNNSKNYAKTLFQLSVESQETDKICGSLKMLEPLYDKEITDFFSNPFVDENTKFNLIKDTFPAMPEIMYDFFSLLIKKNEMKILPEIMKKYSKLVLDFKNIVEAKVISVEKIEKSSLSEIRKILGKFTGKNIVFEESIDKSLLGGIKIETDNLVIDGTIKGKFESIGREFLK
ncbi:MAG TPA: ATP synthase F1 subunit delta [Elusimicrobia bacterium]|nr:ATP synthase F1 subunit delta [Elusimicrobiota bacterium]